MSPKCQEVWRKNMFFFGYLDTWIPKICQVSKKTGIQEYPRVSMTTPQWHAQCLSCRLHIYTSLDFTSLWSRAAIRHYLYHCLEGPLSLSLSLSLCKVFSLNTSLHYSLHVTGCVNSCSLPYLCSGLCPV